MSANLMTMRLRKGDEPVPLGRQWRPHSPDAQSLSSFLGEKQHLDTVCSLLAALVTYKANIEQSATRSPPEKQQQKPSGETMMLACRI
ncbi:unnamed protein product [Nippostrongylus brasiliensis]|uniref:Set apart in position or space protein n=1 Tax=Nippostrongylus brasiliensis TaxID=27835 RepID=A0A0N4XV74_NIPBR|nr:unnamed protein product [Nippostrongylus brasiliensis]